MLNGQLWATSDIKLVEQALYQGFRVIYLGDPMSLDPVYREKFTTATALIPDYHALSLQIDGDMDGFIHLYIASLNSPAALEMLAIIFVCLYRGINIMFYLPPEASGLNYVQYLLQFIEFNFGIKTQTKSTQFSFDPSFIGKIVELMYLHDLVSAQEYLVNSTSLNNSSLRKLVVEMRPNVEDPTNISQIVAWFGRYKDELLKSNGRPLINGIQYAGKDSDYGCCL